MILRKGARDEGGRGEGRAGGGLLWCSPALKRMQM